MAEQAKIEMSLTLAQLDEGSQIRKPISGLPVGGRSELLQEITEQVSRPARLGLPNASALQGPSEGFPWTCLPRRMPPVPLMHLHLTALEVK